ncbi:hypothetical protein Sru01_24730 [Sphaerisporangium rufum]|uniref:YdhG-like domain-containing protein n=1 Tax=Sphaerisporangium rufum TaxID=1381558 RepID=A0A919R314_9ACTN|nr:DUF1801 domain-containing protein [Sphaerisporangium rufum]GII77491.1 hypothetical protein Sru01_24730 [Sphaerisporangium rufum]
MKDSKKPARKTTGINEPAEAFTAEERAAMKERAKEVKASARRLSRAEKAAEEEAAVVAKIAEMPEPDRVLAERLHAIAKETAPDLAPRLWYGMPAYAKEGKIVFFFQAAQKFNTRYATLGFSDKANLDDGAMWPAAYALTGLTPAAEAQIAALVKKAVS